MRREVLPVRRARQAPGFPRATGNRDPHVTALTTDRAALLGRVAPSQDDSSTGEVTMRRWILGLALVVGLALGATACTDDPDPTPKRPGKPAKVAELTYGVFGSPAEVATYQDVVDAYNAQATTVHVTMSSWPTSEAMVADIDAALVAAGLAPAVPPPTPDADPADPSDESSDDDAPEDNDPDEVSAALNAAGLPDIYMVTRTNVGGVVDAGLNVPLFNLLEDRNISYGDGYARKPLEAFSEEADLQCMPYSVSPMVVYINTDLVDFAKMRERELPTPGLSQGSWDMEEFRAAAQFATRKKLHTKGLSLTPSLSSIAPFLYSGGGELFDDASDPTSLDLSSDDNRETLTALLEVARNPRFTLSDAQLEQATPTEWFKKGKLGMIEGFRSLTPELRAIPGLHFDVMPMPRVDADATTGDVTGLCIAPGPNVQRAADFLVNAISEDGYAPVIDAGYVVPVNLAVARSDAFLQPDQQPAHAGIFNAGVDDLVLLPLLETYDELDAAIDPYLLAAFTDPVLDSIDVVTDELDEVSRSVLDPDYEPPTDPPSESPSETPSDSPSESPSESSSEATSESPSESSTP